MSAGELRPEDPGSLTAFATEVYGTTRSRTPLARFADGVYGREDGATYHSPEAIRRKWFAEWRRRVGYGRQGDFDNTVLITAKKGKGQGKSACAIEAASQVDRRFASEFRAKIAFSPAAFLDTVNSLSRYECAVLDEAGDSLLRTEFWSDQSRLLTKAMIVSRDTHATLFLCIPTLKLFNTSVRDSLVDYWLRVETRGRARIHPRPDERYTPFRGTGWFPDTEWNPYVWPRPSEWPSELRTLWRGYQRLRKEFRRGSLADKADEIRTGRSKREGPAVETCSRCGLMGNPYNVRTHRCPKGSPPSRS